jgi:phosphoglycolate phosphatase
MLHIIWDLDGTLIDSQDEILFTIELALSDAGLAISNRKRNIKIGPPLSDMLRNAFSEDYLTDTKLEEVIFHFRKRYDNSDFDMTVPFPGITSIIFDDNFTHHIITNKPKHVTMCILNKFAWTNRIASINTTSSVRNSSCGERIITKADLFKNLIVQYSGKANFFLGIGDMRNDCVSAKKNNLSAIGVLWGTGTKKELIDICDYVVTNTNELHNLLLDFNDEKRR